VCLFVTHSAHTDGSGGGGGGAGRFDPSEWGHQRRERMAAAEAARAQRKRDEAAAAERAKLEAEELDRLRAQGFARVDVNLGGGGGGGRGRGAGGKKGRGRKKGGPPAGFLKRMAQHDSAASARKAKASQQGAHGSGAEGGKNKKKPKKKKMSVLEKVQAIQKKRNDRRKKQKAESEAKAAAMEAHGGDMHKAHYCELIEAYREKHPPQPPSTSPLHLSGRLSVCVRKRPMSKKEAASRQIFDVLTAVASDCLVVHEPKVKLDLSKGLDNHEVRLCGEWCVERGVFDVKQASCLCCTFWWGARLPSCLFVPQFVFDAVFGESSSNEHIYCSTLRSLIPGVFDKGGAVTCFAYGQTGSGKTYTMTALNQYCVRDIFFYAHNRFRGVEVVVSFFEIYMAKVVREVALVGCGVCPRVNDGTEHRFAVTAAVFVFCLSSLVFRFC